MGLPAAGWAGLTLRRLAPHSPQRSPSPGILGGSHPESGIPLCGRHLRDHPHCPWQAVVSGRSPQAHPGRAQGPPHPRPARLHTGEHRTGHPHPARRRGHHGWCSRAPHPDAQWRRVLHARGQRAGCDHGGRARGHGRLCSQRQGMVHGHLSRNEVHTEPPLAVQEHRLQPLRAKRHLGPGPWARHRPHPE